MKEEISIYEDVYQQCCEIIEPHIKETSYGSEVTQDSLCGSVVESLEYLVQFWLANKNKENIDLCL